MVGIYRPPSADPRFLAKIKDLLSQYVNSEMIILCDFNFDWLSDASEYLTEICNNLNLSQLITEPTMPNPKNHNRSTLLDLILSNRSNTIVETGVFDLGIRSLPSLHKGYTYKENTSQNCC